MNVILKISHNGCYLLRILYVEWDGNRTMQG